MKEARFFFILCVIGVLDIVSKTTLCWAWTNPSLLASRVHSQPGSSSHHHRIESKFTTQQRQFPTSLFVSNEDDDENFNSNNNNSSNNNSDDDAKNKKDLKRRMAVVRSLQMSFYAASSEGDNTHPHLDRETGKLMNLPLWRVQWWEVPGRSNVLNVHEPIYTNMFETILYGPKPWCFGHLYLQGGSRNLNSDKDKYQLESWETTTTPATSHQEQGSAIMGCLMNISDYRRMADGRLLLLVHAMERFVVTDVVQKLPYSIVHAQVLPDLEEMDPDLNISKKELLEEQLRYPRALAVQESVRFHDYEYDIAHNLPVPMSSELENKDILQSDLAKVLPFAPFSKTLESPQASSLTLRRSLQTSAAPSSASSSSGKESNSEDTKSNEPCLEYRLLQEGVLEIPGVKAGAAADNDTAQGPYTPHHGLSNDELEYDLWLAINNFLIKTRTPVSPVLLGLLPLQDADGEPMEWPKGFVLKQIAKELNELDKLEHDFVWVSTDYPAYRRQRRLAYCAAHLLETNTDTANDLRPKLLAAPSTHDRLRFVLEVFDHWQQEQWGAFE